MINPNGISHRLCSQNPVKYRIAYMNLIYIYGPPGVGKLSVATQISKRAGIPLFHNHLSVPVSEALFSFGTPEYYGLLDSIRLNVIISAAGIGLASLIFTNAYAVRKNLAFVTRLNSGLAEIGSTVTYVQLMCDQEVLFGRVESPERGSLGKIHKASHLELEMASDDYLSRIPFSPHFTYDTTRLLVAEVTEMIFRDLSL